MDKDIDAVAERGEVLGAGNFVEERGLAHSRDACQFSLAGDEIPLVYEERGRQSDRLVAVKVAENSKESDWVGLLCQSRGGDRDELGFHGRLADALVPRGGPGDGRACCKQEVSSEVLGLPYCPPSRCRRNHGDPASRRRRRKRRAAKIAEDALDGVPMGDTWS